MTPLRKNFLRHALWMGGVMVFSVILTIAGFLKLRTLQQEVAGSFEMQQAAQRLHVEVQVFAALAGQLPLTISLAEADTMGERIESQWQTIADVLVTLGQIEGMAGTISQLRDQVDKIHRLQSMTTATVLDSRRAKASLEDSLAIERNQIRLLHAETIQLASYASGLDSDLSAATKKLRRLIQQVTYLLGGLILLSGLCGVLIFGVQFRLLDRRIIRRIESLKKAMANDTVDDHFKVPSAEFNDEIDQMHLELRELLLRLNEQRKILELQATTDPLTMLSNRRQFNEALNAELYRMKRSGAPLSLVMLDVDHFKQFNDRYGHIQGDECLKRVGQAIKTVAGRTSDVAARFGGEEFVVIAPETNAAGVRSLAENIRRTVEELAIPHEDNTAAAHVTVSLGVVTRYATELTTPEDFVNLADQALYRAKQAGRNRTEVMLRPTVEVSQEP